MSFVTLESILHAFEILSIIGGGIYVSYKVGSATTEIQSAIESQGTMIAELKTETKKIGEVLVTLAITSTRLDNLEADIRELKHGEGFIFPLQRKPSA